jgi:hypothetical protein
MYVIIACFSNPGILGKVREGAENMQQKIQAKSEGKSMTKERSKILQLLLANIYDNYEFFNYHRLTNLL